MKIGVITDGISRDFEHALNVADEASTRVAAKQVAMSVSHVDMLINNAGIMMVPYGLTEEFVEEGEDSGKRLQVKHELMAGPYPTAEVVAVGAGGLRSTPSSMASTQSMATLCGRGLGVKSVSTGSVAAPTLETLARRRAAIADDLRAAGAGTDA